MQIKKPIEYLDHTEDIQTAEKWNFQIEHSVIKVAFCR